MLVSVIIFYYYSLCYALLPYTGPQHDWTRDRCLRRHLCRGGQAQEVLQQEGRARCGSTSQRGGGEWRKSCLVYAMQLLFSLVYMYLTCTLNVYVPARKALECVLSFLYPLHCVATCNWIVFVNLHGTKYRLEWVQVLVGTSWVSCVLLYRGFQVGWQN